MRWKMKVELCFYELFLCEVVKEIRWFIEYKYICINLFIVGE